MAWAHVARGLLSTFLLEIPAWGVVGQQCAPPVAGWFLGGVGKDSDLLIHS